MEKNIERATKTILIGVGATLCFWACDNHNSTSSGGGVVPLSTIATSSGTVLNVSGMWNIQIDHPCPGNASSYFLGTVSITQSSGTITSANFTSGTTIAGSGGSQGCDVSGGPGVPQFSSGTIDAAGNVTLNFSNNSCQTNSSPSFKVAATASQNGQMNGHWTQAAGGSCVAYAAFFGGSHQSY